MRRKLLYFLGGLIILFATALIILVTQVDSLIQSQQSTIERVLADQSGFEINLGHLSVKLFPTPSLNSRGLSLKNKALAGEGFSLGELSAKLKLLPLLKGAVDISEIKLTQPQVKLLRTSTGIEISGLVSSAQNKKVKIAAARDATAQNTAAPATLPEFLKVDLKKFLISNGKIVFEDTVLKKQFTLDKLELQTGLQVADSIIQLKDGLVAGQLNDLQLNASLPEVSFDSAKQQVSSDYLSIKLDQLEIELAADFNLLKQSGAFRVERSSFDLARTKKVLKQLVQIDLPLEFTGTFLATAKTELLEKKIQSATSSLQTQQVATNFGPIALTELLSQLSIIRLPNGDFRLNSQKISFKLNDELGTLSLNSKPLPFNGNGSFEIFGGKGSFVHTFVLDGLKLSGSSSLSGIALEKAARALLPNSPVAITGTLASETPSFSLNFGPELLNSVQAKTSLTLKDGALKDINLAREVLAAVKDIPGLSGTVKSVIPKEASATLEAADTPIKSLVSTATIENQKLILDSLTLDSDLFALTAKGEITFAKKIDLDAQFKLIPEIASQVVLKVSELEGLVDEQGYLNIPVKLKGTLPKLLVFPDIKKILSATVEKKAKQKAYDLLDKAIGSKTPGAGKQIGDLLGF